MNNSVEYQELLNQILEIKEYHKKLLKKNEQILSLLRDTILIDDSTFKEYDIKEIINNENKIIEEIDNVIIPLIRQKMM